MLPSVASCASAKGMRTRGRRDTSTGKTSSSSTRWISPAESPWALGLSTTRVRRSNASCTGRGTPVTTTSNPSGSEASCPSAVENRRAATRIAPAPVPLMPRIVRAPSLGPPARRAPEAPLHSVVAGLLGDFPAGGAEEQQQILHRPRSGVGVVVPHARRIGVRLSGRVILRAGHADAAAVAVGHEGALEHVDERRHHVPLPTGLPAGLDLDRLAAQHYRDAHGLPEAPEGRDERTRFHALGLGHRRRRLRQSRRAEPDQGEARDDRRQGAPLHGHPSWSGLLVYRHHLIAAPVIPVMNLSRNKL